MTLSPALRCLRASAALVLLSLALTGCATAKFVPYEGAQQDWPTSPGAFVAKDHDVPVYHGPPSRPYRVLGFLDATTAPIRQKDVVPYAATRAKEFGGDALILLQEGTEYAGTTVSGSGYTSGTLSGNSFQGRTSYGATAYPMFKGRATLLVIKFKQ